jgi:hypothetical protein
MTCYILITHLSCLVLQTPSTQEEAYDKQRAALVYILSHLFHQTVIFVILLDEHSFHSSI